MLADICPLLNADMLSSDCKGVFGYVGYETQIAGSEIWPAEKFGAPYTGFRLTVEGSNGLYESVEVSISGLSCAHDWFFGNPSEWCPIPAVTSLATAQRFQHGQMIWLKELDQFYIFYDSELQAWPTNLDFFSRPPASSAAVDPHSSETPPAGTIEPVGDFGLIWRTDEHVRQRLGWATAPEIGFKTVYQCSVSSFFLNCLPDYLRDPEGKILNLYYVMHFGTYWKEAFNWETYTKGEYDYAIKYPDFLSHSMDIYKGTGGIVTVDKWLPPDQSYAISVFSYKDGTNPALEFKAVITNDETTQVAGFEVRKLVGTEIVAHTGSLIHIGPINHAGKNHMLTYTSGSRVADPKSLEIFYQMLATFHFMP